ncbi:MAG TPA: hypothetical protein VFY23_09830 [Candidatus Limnocylindrales bacterium]|nr:hypothetical protein [Candidatus Limnocylindrales bacterium]
MTKPRAAQADPTPDLSEAARAVVRDPGDPRTDAFLAALGLGDEPTPAPGRPGTVPTPGTEELVALRARAGELEAALAAASARARRLGVALGIALVAVVILGLVVLANLA